MRKAEVQPAIPYILRRREIVRLLLGCHRVPDPITLLVAPDVVQLRAGVEDEEVDAADRDQHAVSAPVPRRVVLAVDVRGDDGAQLHEHVVQRRVHRAACDRTGVARAPADLDRVRVRVGQKCRREALDREMNVRYDGRAKCRGQRT